MLTEEEKRELLEMARSEKIREEFRKLAVKVYPMKGGEIDLDWYLKFLTTFSNLFNNQRYPKKRLPDSGKFLL